MKKTIFLFSALLCMALTGCKNDDEQDYLDYLASLNQPTPDNPAGDETEGKITLNELDGNAKFIELYNTGDEAADISGYSLYKDESKTIYVAPAGTTVPAKGFLVLEGNAIDYTAGFTSGLSADKATIVTLLDADGNLLDTFCNPPLDPSGTWQDAGLYSGKTGKRSFSRYTDGTGDWYISESTPGMANVQGDTKITW